MTLGNVVHSQSHLGHMQCYRFDHCKEYFYISLFQLEVYVLKFLVLLQLVDVLHYTFIYVKCCKMNDVLY